MTKRATNTGQLFITGFPGETPRDDFLAFLRQEQLGGVILFQENCPSYGVTRDTISKINQQFDSSTPIIAVDQEGGRVCRLKGAPAEFAAAADYGREGDIDHYREDYNRSAVYMDSLGINANFAPVADLALEEDNSCLDGRCFGTTAEQVIPFVKATIELSRRNKLLSCVKHFPGLGAARSDPHHTTPEVDYDYILWSQREALPFEAAVEAGVDLIMTTHVRVSPIDETIATGAKSLIKEWIRSHLRFEGPVITDDLTMEGAAALGDIGQRTVAAFNAGHDLLLFGRNFSAMRAAYEYFLAAIERGEIAQKRINQALQRITSIKCKLAKPVVS